MSLTLEWMIGADDSWCLLDSLDLTVSYFDKVAGVFIVWYGPSEKGDDGRVVCIGQGSLRCKIENLRKDPIIARYSCRKPLVTWAEVDHLHRPGVEAYLQGILNPLHGEPHPSVVQTIVNVPPW